MAVPFCLFSLYSFLMLGCVLENLSDLSEWETKGKGEK